jgi:6-phosphogluconate dehydrogenase
MRFGIIGLGRIGGGLAQQAIEKGHQVVGYNRSPQATREVRWAVEYALEREAWIPVIAQAELALYRYRDPDSVVGKAAALLRHGFGGHPLHKRFS